MIVNGQQHDGATFEADVCIVGAGAAGLTLALDLAQRGISVVLVESGGRRFAWKYHKLLSAEVTGIGHSGLVRGTRERFFGGTTNHWGGVCRPFDSFEFEQHAWVPHSGWPINHSDLAPYFEHTAKLLGLPESMREFDPQKLGVADRHPLVSSQERDVKKVIWQRVPEERLRFGQWRFSEVKESQALNCVMHTTIAELYPVRGGERIEHLQGRTFSGGSLRFQAKDYVLCTGAIENARLLLASDSVVPGGLGNEHDVVGRYYMDHSGRDLGRLLRYPAAAPSQEEVLVETEMVGWATTNEVRSNEQLLGFMAFLFPNRPQPIPQELGIVRLHQRTAENSTEAQGIFRRPILLNWEQSPNPESRILLSAEKDALGVRKPVINWQVNELDVKSLLRSAEMLSLAIARSGSARLHMEDLTQPIGRGGGHHTGSTRMSTDPKFGVTDENARVHSVENLFIGGSSLFPTGGWQHPTFNFIALVLRLADHLAKRHGH